MPSQRSWHDRTVQHIGQVDHGEHGRTAVRQYCDCVASGRTPICSYSVRIKAIIEAVSNVARDPVVYGRRNAAP